jgi:hypothetical protein
MALLRYFSWFTGLDYAKLAAVQKAVVKPY